MVTRCTSWAYVAAVLLLTIVSTATARYSGGTGEPNDPYQVATAADLILLGETPEDYDKHFILTADIDLDPNLPGRKVFDKAVIGLRTLVPQGDGTWEVQIAKFEGVFDGNGHVISHLVITGGDSLGLFGQLAPGAEVKNLGVVDVNIAGSGSFIGGLVGHNWGGALTQCYSTGAVGGAWEVGGLVGQNWGGAVTQCYSTCVVSGYQHVGGLMGEGFATDCYSTGAVTGTLYVGGLVGRGHATRCYSIGKVSGSSYVGGLVGDDDARTTASFWDTQTSGRTTSASGTGKTTNQMRTASTFLIWGTCGNEGVWTIDEGRDYPRLWWESQPGEPITVTHGIGDLVTGEGTAQSPYLIHSADELNLIGVFPCDWDKHYKLLADIDLSAFDDEEGRPTFNIIGSGGMWAPNSPEDRAGDTYGGGPEGIPFTGVFDGNGHAVANFTFATDTGRDYIGLFGYVGDPNALIKDLRLIDPNVRVTGDNVDYPGYPGGRVGCLVGWLEVGTITRCSVENARVEGRNAGGLVGVNCGSITQSCSTGVVTGESSVGGLVGFIYFNQDFEDYGTVTNCYSSATVTGAGDDVGGLVGQNWGGTVTHCYSTGSVSGVNGIGGLVGSGWATHCYSTGSVRGNSYVGGLVGSGGALRCVWDMETSGQPGSAGGVSLTTAEMRDPYMLGLNGFADDPNWVLDAGRDYPRLAWEGTPGGIIPEPIIDWLEGQGTPDSPYRINAAGQLVLLRRANVLWDRHFVLEADVDLDPNLPGGQIFADALIPSFTGVFDGNGHIISHLKITGGEYAGLLGYLGSGAQVKDLGVVDVNVVGSRGAVGALVGASYGTVTRCYSSGAVGGTGSVGGLVGSNHYGSVTQCYSSGAVRGDHTVGGLVGYNMWGTVTQCYSTGAVRGSGERVGGLVGCIDVGRRVTACFWDTQTSGQTTSAGGTGKTTAEMQAASTFLDAGWDFVGETVNGTADIWWILEGKDYPRLWWEQGDEASP